MLLAVGVVLVLAGAGWFLLDAVRTAGRWPVALIAGTAVMTCLWIWRASQPGLGWTVQVFSLVGGLLLAFVITRFRPARLLSSRVLGIEDREAAAQHDRRQRPLLYAWLGGVLAAGVIAAIAVVTAA